jgi:hypothetical protein
VDARGQVVVSVVTLVGAAGILWAALRISLAEAETVAVGKIKVLETWPLTRGLTAPILIGGLVLFAPLILAPVVLSGAARDPAAAWAASIAAGAWVGGLWLPTSVGLMAYFHARRAPLPQP